jgi:hypothetical protein
MIRFFFERRDEGFPAGLYAFQLSDFLVRHSAMRSIKSRTSNKTLSNLGCKIRFSA